MSSYWYVPLSVCLLSPITPADRFPIWKDIKHAGLIVQAYFFLNSSIANLYVDMHPTYVVPGLELLRELRWATTDDVCQQKNKLLDAYDKEMEYGLSVYMRNVQFLPSPPPICLL